MFDVTQHKWGSPTLIVNCSNPFMLALEDSSCEWVQIFTKDDAIAIAKHFGLIKDNSTVGRRCTLCGTHLSHNAPEDSCLCGNNKNIVTFGDSVGEISNSELFNKGDCNG